jgi:flagellar M-ring protein FliF
VDFTQSEATSEEFKPNQGASTTATVRSQQTTEQAGGNAAQPAGVPGAASNQPPVPATAPLTGQAQALQAGQAGGAGGNSRREALTKFEVDKTVRVTRAATGTVKRLNAAVVVNHRSVTDAKGVATLQPLSDEEIEKLSALVRESIGFNKERGDSVKVINAPFQVVPLDSSELPLWKQPWLLDLVRGAAAPLGLALVALLVYFGMVKPSMKAVLNPPPPPPGSTLNAVVADGQTASNANGAAGAPTPGAPLALEAPAPNMKLEQARQFTKENPAATANIVRSWVSGEPA